MSAPKPKKKKSSDASYVPFRCPGYLHNAIRCYAAEREISVGAAVRELLGPVLTERGYIIEY